MSDLTLNSKISDLILAMGDVLEESGGKTTTFDLEIPGQSFYLEIAIKAKDVGNEME